MNNNSLIALFLGDYSNISHPNLRMLDLSALDSQYNYIKAQEQTPERVNSHCNTLSYYKE